MTPLIYVKTMPKAMLIKGVLGVDIISMEVPEVAESGKDLVLDCNYDYR